MVNPHLTAKTSSCAPLPTSTKLGIHNPISEFQVLNVLQTLPKRCHDQEIYSFEPFKRGLDNVQVPTLGVLTMSHM